MEVVALLTMAIIFTVLLPHEVVVGKVSKDGFPPPYASSKSNWGKDSKPLPDSMRAMPRQAFLDVPLGQECNSYKNLSNADRAQRAVTSVNAELCDRNPDFPPGWYRFTGDAGDKMATSCVPILRCMAAATGWLNGLHPNNSVIVEREVCFNWKQDCCLVKVNVRVKLCHGFYIYELPAALSHCNFRYCGNAVGPMKKPSQCGGNLTTLTSEITSPGYPNFIEPITCHWTIKAPFDGNILLYFENITLGHGGCFSNNLTVEGDKTETFCYRRDLNSFSILVAKRTVNIYYKSVYWNKKLGFKLKYLMLKENLDSAQAHSQWSITTRVNGPSSINVSWKVFDNSFISSDQTLYGLVVVCKPLKLIQRTVHVMVQHSATNVKVTGLTGGTEYKVQVVGLVKDRNSMASVSMYGSTTATIATSKGECEIYKNLTSQRRSQSAPGGPWCDQRKIYTPYWYRFAEEAGTQIATSCVPQDRCHTVSPGWMDGAHPSVQDGVVMRTVCFHRLGECCRWETTIRVRKCDGFYVYQLHYPPMCDLGYCGNSGGCGKFIKDASGELKNPGYPKRIYWNSKCLWDFAAPSSSGVIVVVVEDLRIPGSPPCVKFSLSFQNVAGKQVGQACGIQRFFTWVSEHSAKLKFVSDKADSRWLGFKARYFIFNGSLTNIPVIPQWTGVSAQPINSTSITVRWGPYSNHSVTEYLIICVPDGLPLNATVFIKEYANVLQFSVMVSGLMKYTNYTVQIVVQTSGEKASFSGYRGSQKTRVETKEDIPSEGPSDVKATSAGRNRMMVSWNPIPKHARNGIITHYVIYYKKVMAANTWTEITVNKPAVINGTRMMAYLERLEPRKYVMQMAGATSVGVGTKSIQIYFTLEQFTTTPLPTPTAPPTPEKHLRMYPYGDSAGDSMVPNTKEYMLRCFRINIPGDGLQFFKKRHHMIHICRNGLLLFETRRPIRWPYRLVEERPWLKQASLLAPYWSLIDDDRSFVSGISKVYYQTYNDSYESRKMILQATYDVENLHLNKLKLYKGDFTKPKNFKAKWVLVITWVNLRPFGVHKLRNFNLTNTFQAVLITDGMYAFAMYNYPVNGIQWAAPAPLDKHHLYESTPGLPVAGWNVGDTKLEHYDVEGSGQTAMVKIDKRPGKTVKVDLKKIKVIDDQISQGKWFFRLEAAFYRGKSPKDQCNDWFKTKTDHSDYTKHLDPCPCTQHQASNDRRFIMDSEEWPIICVKSVNASGNSYYWEQKCCYSTFNGALVKGYPGGGYPIAPKIKTGKMKYDNFAYEKCCVESSTCDLFYKKRPSDDCLRYNHPKSSWFVGDPHFVTLDGLNYTFNGLGEYIMADISNGLFQLQARTKLVEDGGKATVFVSAVAKETGSSAVQVNLKARGLEVLVNGTAIDHTTLTNTITRYNGSVALSRPDNNSITVLFPCGISVKMTNVKDSLVTLLAAPEKFKNKTRGLLGVWNGDPNDDLTTPTGRVLPTDSTGRTIHYEFGQKWSVTDLNSLFTYNKGQSVSTFSNSSFEPMFIEDYNFTNDAVRQEALEKCEGDVNCLFDAALTNDVTMGTSTKIVGSNFKNESEALQNKVPMFLNHSSFINVTVNTTARIEVVAKDDDGDQLRFDVSGKLPDNMDQDTSSGHSIVISWGVTMDKIKLEFTVTDDKGAAALWRPKVYVCACHNGGYCAPDSSNNVFADSTNDTFLIMPCTCIHGYTGRFCENDLDACQANLNPCYPGVKCTDLPPPANDSGYKCGACPRGFSGDGATCLDVDECNNGKQGCSHICVNTPGSFVCDCKPGYRLDIDQKRCNDVDECLPSSDCMHKCKNTPGNYTCECNDGFKVDPNNRKKCVPKLPCTDGNHGCQHTCYTKDGRQKCACHQGYKLKVDQKSCEDIDECKPAVKRCSQYCNNTKGSYKCWCKKGFILDNDLITCVDVDECMQLTYQCPDPSQLCLNTEGTYKCICGEGLYLTKNNTCREIDGPVPPEKPNPPKHPTENERGNSINVTVQGLNVDEWYKPLEKRFKDAVANAVTNYCASRDEDCKKKRERERRALDYILYTADQVHLLPDFPKQINLKSRDLAAVIAFYVEFPPEVVSTSGDSIKGGILVEIVGSAKADIEKALNRTISSITWDNKEEPSTTAVPLPPKSSNTLYIIIGVSVGAVVLLVIVVILVRRHVNKNRSERQEKNRRGVQSPGINNQSFDGIGGGEDEGEAFQFRPLSEENRSKDDGNEYVQMGKDNPDVDGYYSDVNPKVDEKCATPAEYSEIPAKPGAQGSSMEIGQKSGEEEKYSEIAEKPAGTVEKAAL